MSHLWPVYNFFNRINWQSHGAWPNWLMLGFPQSLPTPATIPPAHRLENNPGIRYVLLFMNRPLTALVSLLLASPSLAQGLPAMDEPPLPQQGPPPPGQEPPAVPEFIRLIPEDIIGTWHGIEPGDGDFAAWEINYHGDGTYELRMLSRHSDSGETTEEVSGGTWNITEDGFLDLDDGEMLLKPVRRDNTRTVYQVSSPREPDAEPWTLHEFEGAAPPVIFDLAPPINRNAPGEPGPEQTQFTNLRQLLLGCSAYAVQNGGQFPAKLSVLEPNFGAEVLAGLRMFTNPVNQIQTPWTVVAGRNITDPHGTILMHSPSYGDGKRIVGFIDGTATILSEEEFAGELGRKTE